MEGHSDEKSIIHYCNRGSEVENAAPACVFYSEALEQDAAAATFTVDLNTTLSNPGGGKYRYVAVSPSNADYYWSDEAYYADCWSDADQSLPVHPVIGLQFPTVQCPTATSFDPDTDILVSKVTALESRADGNIDLYYTRVGGVVKMTLTGLPAMRIPMETRIKSAYSVWATHLTREQAQEAVLSAASSAHP